MKKKNLVILILIVILVALGGLLWFEYVSDTPHWVCQEGEWVAVGDVSEEMPTEACGAELDQEEEVGQGTVEEEIHVFDPQSNDIISSPLKVSGEAFGTWFFEANAGLQVVAEDGTVLATGYVMATEDWMQDGFVAFEGEIEFDSLDYESGYVVFTNDNPSDLPENNKEYKVPVYFNQEPQNLTVSVFFSNTNEDPEMLDCAAVYAVDRQIPYTKAVATAAITELLKGPSQAESDHGYVTSINEGVKLNSIIIDNRVAKVDFDDQLQYQVGGSCKVSAIYAQIKQTLLQFSTVDDVIISINGETEGILQP